MTEIKINADACYQQGTDLIKKGVENQEVNDIRSGIEQLKLAANEQHSGAQKCLGNLKAKANPRHASILVFSGDPAQISFKDWEIENLLKLEQDV